MSDEFRNLFYFIAYLFILFGGPFLLIYLFHYLYWLLFYRRKGVWVKRLFRNNSEVDWGNIKKQLSNKEFPIEKLTAWEMVAVFCMFQVDAGISVAIYRSERFGDLGWEDKYDQDFFSVLEQTGRKVSNKGKKKRARELFSLGHRLAEKYNKEFWVERYWELLNNEHESITSLEWDASKRVKM